MPKTISIDSPLSEITLRRYEKPYNMSRRESIRKFCLSIGLLQPGDSRDIIVDIMQVILDAKKRKKLLTSEEIQKSAIKQRRKNRLPVRGVAASNIRRQIRRLKEIHIIEKIKNEYRVTEFENISRIFEERIEKFYLTPIKKRVEEYCKIIK